MRAIQEHNVLCSWNTASFLTSYQSNSWDVRAAPWASHKLCRVSTPSSHPILQKLRLSLKLPWQLKPISQSYIFFAFWNDNSDNLELWGWGCGMRKEGVGVQYGRKESPPY